MANLIPRMRYKDSNRVSILNHERDRLSVDITAAMETEVLKRRYNKVVDRLTELEQSPLDDPLRILPHELLIMIFKEGATQDKEEINGILSLMMVSTEWRDMIISTPDLWTHIAIGDVVTEANPDALAKLATALALSKDLRLHLVVYPFIFYWESILPLLQPHVTRIGSIYVMPTNNLHHIFRSLGYLPQLKHLALPSGLNINLETIMDNIPNLTVLDYDHFTEDEMRHPNTGNLRHCTTQVLLSKTITALASFEFLQSLILLPTIQEDVSCLSQLPTSLALRRFLSEQDEAKLALDVIKLSPFLTTAHIKIGSALQILFELFDIAAALVHLDEFQLELTIPDERIEFPRRSKNITVRVLQLLIVSEEKVESGLQNTLAFWNYLEGSTPLLSTAVFSLSGNMTMQWRYINNLRHLRYLSLYIDPDISLLDDAPINSTIEDMYLEADSHTMARFLSNLRFTRLLKLSYRVDWDPHATADIPELSLGDCPNIEVIEWNDCPLRDIHSLRSLRRVVFSACGMRVISNFCLQLIIRPEICPQLEQIEFSNCLPEWDWFILMLERRNLLPDIRALPLRTLIFSYSLSKMLGKTIIDLLHCKYPARPSLEDLTFGSCMDVYFDLSMYVCLFKYAFTNFITSPTCLICCLTFNICSNSRYMGRDSVEDYYGSPIDFLQDMPEPPLSKETELWLQGRVNRELEQVKRMKRLPTSGFLGCRLHGYKNPSILTALSYYGSV